MRPHARFREVGEEGLTRALGWFSIALGLAEVLAPRGLAKMIGVPERPVLLRALGLRELTSGVGILARPTPAAWMWSRVAGDAIDLALLGMAFGAIAARRGRVAAAGAAVAGVTALDIISSQWLSSRPRARDRRSPDGTIAVARSIAINRSPEQVYRFWRDRENLPRVVRHLASVDAEIVDEAPNQRIAWRSLPGADVEHAGSVRFERAPGGRGTLVRVELRYRPRAGVVGAMVARLFGEEPAQQMADDLRRLKQVIETGEISTNAGPSARRGTR